MSKTTNKFSPEVRERAVRLVLDQEGKQKYHLDHERSGDLVVVADSDSWFTYYFWLDDAKAPDYARCVDIVTSAAIKQMIIPALIPLALKGIQFRPLTANQLLQRNILIYGLGGVIAPFIAIKLIDMMVTFVGLA
jgi:hypothetical protein